MTVDPWYWAFAAVQTLLPLTALTCAGLYAAWWWDTRRAPPPPLRALLLLIALFDVAVAVESIKWIADRMLDTAYAVATIRAISSARSYVEFVAVKAALLTIAAAQAAAVWRVRRHSFALFGAIFAGLVAGSIAAAGFHHRQLEAHCFAQPRPSC